MHYSILYRGPLSSCNYGCEYCPFAKRSQTHAELAGDRAALERFIGWCETQLLPAGHELSVLFTPWGEALIRPWYQQALARLTRLPHVRRAAIQTNISCQLSWIDECDLAKLGLWCTYHPTETTRARFLAQCHELDARHVRYSVGIVGLKEHAAEAQWLRESLKPHVYLWVNAYKRIDNYYEPSDLALFTAIDPLFPMNSHRHPSLGRPCRTGHEAFSVDGEGTMRRCHFDKQPIGNIYQPDWESALKPRPCAVQNCGCHIGYVHMPELGLYEVFGEGVLERIPSVRIWTDGDACEAAPIIRRTISLPQVSASGW